MHSEIREGRLGNCLSLQQISILNTTYQKLEQIINDFIIIYNQIEKDICENKDLINFEHNYCFLSSENNVFHVCLAGYKTS